MPTEDGAGASVAADNGQPIAAPDLSTDDPVDASSALPFQLTSPVSLPQPAEPTAIKTALLSAAAAGGANPEELTASSGNDDSSVDVDADAAARQAAAGQALAAALPAPKAQLRPVDSAPLKDVPANASTEASSDTEEVTSQSRATDASSKNSTAAGLSDQSATPPAAPAGQQPALARSPEIEAAVAAPAPSNSSTPGPVNSSPGSAPVAPVIVTNISNLSQVTVETTVQIAAQITRKLEGRSTRFEMGMTPEGLGRVDISLDIDAGGKLTARLAFDNPLAATEMRGKADELRRELQDAGFTIANDGLEFSERQSSRDRGFDRNQSRAFAGATRVNADADLIPPTPAAWVSLSLTPRGVDMKV